MTLAGQVWLSDDKRAKRYVLVISVVRLDAYEARQRGKRGEKAAGWYAMCQTCTEDGTKIRSAPYTYVRIKPDGDLLAFKIHRGAKLIPSELKPATPIR